MNNSLKKISALTIALILCAPFISVSADTSSSNDISDYIFYLEFIQHKPQVSTDAKYPYYIIPVVEHAPLLTFGEFRGDIISVRGKSLTSFWFNTPTTTIVALGKSSADVYAPYFADADHVNFYTSKGTKPLFSISVKGSSFCNDNNKCEKDIGEDYNNCSNDCPAPVQSATTPITPAPETNPSIPNKPIVAQTTESGVNLPGTNEGTTTRTASATSNSSSSVVQLTIGIFLVLFSFVGYLAWKRHAANAPEGFE